MESVSTVVSCATGPTCLKRSCTTSAPAMRARSVSELPQSCQRRNLCRRAPAGKAVRRGAGRDRNTHHSGTLKYGFGVNVEQEITGTAGAFLRLGWNDGKTETFAFTAIDRLASAGVSPRGARWKRPFDTAGTALTVSGISGVHAACLARGGLDFIIGDGALGYAPEYVSETYYSARLFSGIFAIADLQRVISPAFNRDRAGLQKYQPYATFNCLCSTFFLFL